MMRPIHAIAAALLVVSGSVASNADAQQPSATLTAFLRDNIGLLPTQLAAIERGDVVVKVLTSANDRDVSVFGIVPIDMARAQYIAGIRDYRTSLIAPTRPHFGIFSEPPVAADLRALVVSKEEAEDLEKCKPGDCAMKLPMGDIRLLRERMPWSSPTLSAAVSAFARERFLEYVLDYRARGDAAMAVFADRGNVSAKVAFADMLSDSPYVFQKAPSIARYLTAYPTAKLPDAAEVFYWSQDDLPRLRPIISITHQIVLTPAELPSATFIAAKQIYANHYFEAGVDLTVVSDRIAANGARGSYLMTLRRYRFDKLPGGILNIKGKATEALRDQLQQDLMRRKEGVRRK